MKRYILTKKLKDASIAHRLVKNYPKSCRNIHGHTYHFEATIELEGLDKYDMGIDFADIKKICDKYIQDNWDHTTLVSAEDKSFIRFLKKENMKHFVFPGNTTAENMSEFLTTIFFVKLNAKYPNINCVQTRVWETEESSASHTIFKDEI